MEKIDLSVKFYLLSAYRLILPKMPISSVEPDNPPVETSGLNYRPIIGILAQTTVSPNSTTYIGASYVKFLESAGARVVPIFIDRKDSYYENMFQHTNGLLLPGGGVSIINSGE